jgi:RimJ/RimL family protein N-acetyltransferase
MSDRIALNEPTYGPVIAGLAGTDYHPTISVNFARVVDEEFLGGVLFSNYTGESINIHSGSVTPLWINRDMLFVTFDYPFRQLEVKRIFGHVPEDNLRAISFNENLGFRKVVRIEGVFPNNVACLVMRMDLEECRFLNIKPRFLHPGVTLH